MVVESLERMDNDEWKRAVLVGHRIRGVLTLNVTEVAGGNGGGVYLTLSLGVKFEGRFEVSQTKVYFLTIWAILYFKSKYLQL